MSFVVRVIPYEGSAFYLGLSKRVESERDAYRYETRYWADVAADWY